MTELHRLHTDMSSAFQYQLYHEVIRRRPRAAQAVFLRCPDLIVKYFRIDIGPAHAHFLQRLTERKAFTFRQHIYESYSIIAAFTQYKMS
jgi:hypothetical protein